MALIIPTAASTYGDSTTTEGGRLRKYVLAQFRSDAELEWVKALRARLVKDELKYANFRDTRPKLRSEQPLWSQIEAGIGQASIIVIDPQPMEADIREAVKAELRGDSDAALEEHIVTEACASEIVANTPIAYLPFELSKAVPWGSYDFIASIERFTPEHIRSRIGGGLRHAQIFAARAHALFDLKASGNDLTTTDGVFRSPLAPVMLAELLATSRSFDEENPATLPVLNEAANEIGLALAAEFPNWGQPSATPMIREVSSRAIDEIQAADIAAGWARDILEVSEPRSLGSQFERVWVNGKRIK
jgi:hypothetical protein